MHTAETSLALERGALDRPSSITGTNVAYWALRVGAAACFIGHGAFGFITKAAWLPYFAVVGIPEAWGWKLMPMIGTVDVLTGMAVLFAPRGWPLVYMAVWALWTALLRPLSGESPFEVVERAGNYGVPLALLLLTVPRHSWAAWRAPVPSVTSDSVARQRAMSVLKWTTVLLLAGHGALGAISEKALLTSHFASIDLPARATVMNGWFEMLLAVMVAVRPVTGLLALVVVWKLATESLFLVAGAPVWEMVERGGSFAAPLALAALQWHRRAPSRDGQRPDGAKTQALHG